MGVIEKLYPLDISVEDLPEFILQILGVLVFPDDDVFVLTQVLFGVLSGLFEKRELVTAGDAGDFKIKGIL